jgi:hypothetical protein
MSDIFLMYNLKGNLDKASPNAGYVLLMFYHLYDGKVHLMKKKLFCAPYEIYKLPILTISELERI